MNYAKQIMAMAAMIDGIMSPVFDPGWKDQKKNKFVPPKGYKNQKPKKRRKK